MLAPHLQRQQSLASPGPSERPLGAGRPCATPHARRFGASRLITAVATNGKGEQPAPSKGEPQEAGKELGRNDSFGTDVLSLSLLPEGAIHNAPQAKSLRRSSTATAVEGAKERTVNPSGAHPNVVRTTGLRRTPLGGGVKNATQRYDLPPPAVAVRNLVERAHFAHLCTIMSKMHHRRASYPFGTLVDFACDGAGFPILCLSPLGIHTRNLSEDPRSSIVVQMPGWTGLANARVTIFGDVYRVPEEMVDLAREIFLEKHSNDKREKWVSGNFMFFRMHRITDIYFVGGFGTLQWVNVDEYAAADPDPIVMDKPDKTIRVLNERYGPQLGELIAAGDVGGSPVQDAHVISVDRLGLDVRLRKDSDYSVERIGFCGPVDSLEQAIGEMDKMFA